MKLHIHVAFASLALVCTISASSGLQNQTTQRCAAPVVIDTDGNGIELTSLEEGVTFAICADGIRRRTAWTARGSDDAFLAVDENHNGRIDGAFELVGGTLGPPNGFAYLAAMDGVSDPTRPRERSPHGEIDKRDALYRELILWTDRNHNGVSEEDELESFEHAGFTSIRTGYQGVDSRDSAGNVLLFRSTAFRKNDGGVPVARDAYVIRLLIEPR